MKVSLNPETFPIRYGICCIQEKLFIHLYEFQHSTTTIIYKLFVMQ